MGFQCYLLKFVPLELISGRFQVVKIIEIPLKMCKIDDFQTVFNVFSTESIKHIVNPLPECYVLLWVYDVFSTFFGEIWFLRAHF